LISKRLGEGWIPADGIRYLARFVVISDLNLMVGVRVPEADVYAERNRYLLTIGGAALAILIAGSLLAFFVGRSLTGRVKATLEALDAVSAGEFGVRIPDSSNKDELSGIQRRINDLADSFARRATEREAATKWLEENEKRFRDFAEAASDAFWETDADLRYTFFANPGHDFVSFRNTENIVGSIRGQYIDEAGFFAGDWEQHLEDLKAHRVVRNFEFSGQHPDGKVFHRASSAIPLFDAEGTFAGYRGTTTDITDRVETRNRLENLVANLPGLVFQRLLSPDGTIDYSYLSTSSADWLGDISVEEKMAAWRTQRMAHPEDRDRVRRVIVENARNGNAFTTEFRSITPNGDIVWLKAVCATPVPRPDGVIVQDGIVFDITDLKTAEDEAEISERRLTDFAIAASDTLWETDSEHRLNWMSDPASRENRYLDTNIMLGRKRWEFPGVAPPEDKSWAPLMEALDNLTPFRDFEFASRLEDGQQVYRRISGRPVFNENGDFTGYRGISSDITKQVLKDREARETQQRLIDAIEASDQGVVLFGADDRLIFANRYSLDLSPELTEVFVPGVSYEDMIRSAARDGNFPAAAANEEAWIQERLDYHRDPSGPFTNIMIGDRYIEIREERLSNGGLIIRQTDVTDQTIAQEAVRKSEQRFRDFAESSSDWMWETDSDFRFTSATGGAEGSEDLTPNDFLGRTRWESMGVDVENDENWRNHIDDLIAHRSFRNFRYSRVSASGRVLHRSTSGVPFYDPADATFLGYRGTTADITDQVEAEQRYRNLIEQSPMPMIVHDGDTVSYLNSAAIELAGASSADELTDKSVIDFIHPDEREGFRDRVKNVLESGNTSPLTEQRRLRVDGSEITVMTRGVPVMWEGKRAVLGALIDISDRVEAERQYRELIENAPMALSIDDGVHFIFVNQAFAELFGKDRPEDVIGREIVEMAHPDDLDDFQDRVRAVAQYRRTLPIAQIRRRRFDGSTFGPYKRCANSMGGAPCITRYPGRHFRTNRSSASPRRKRRTLPQPCRRITPGRPATCRFRTGLCQCGAGENVRI
jgi:PAS domain S-box-containing protein